MSVLSLGLLLPFGAGAFPDRAIAMLTDAAGEPPAKHVTFVNGSTRETVTTRTTTMDGFLRERGLTLQPQDSVSQSPESALTDGEIITYRPAVSLDIVVDGVDHPVHTSAGNVSDALAGERLVLGPHDTVEPSLASPIEPHSVVHITRATSWLERVHTAIVPPIRRKFDIGLANGEQRVLDPGSSGTKETTVEVLQPRNGVAPQRRFLAARILRFPRAKVIAQGVGDYSALAGIARRGVTATLRLADAALRMVATAYTAGCAGCSGVTASGRPAGRGVVAVDPRYIRLGTHLFIPGYGHAFAGDTGSAIHGNRIDLGFDSHRDALTFGRRQIVVYVLK